ncbi:MAG: lipid A deacylase LpxR family protein [Ekhidna sp.]
MRNLLISFILLQSIVCHGQQLNRELQVESDNDAYTLNVTRDQYYSSGIFLRYRFVRDSSKRKEGIEKKIRSYSLNHRIFTPKKLEWDDVQLMDRPYAGQLSLAASNETYYKSEAYLKIMAELGWMGSALGTEDLQYSWHKLFGMQLPFGWDYEIGNAPIINGYATYAKTLASGEELDLISESNAAAGTTFNYLRQEFVIRFGTRKPIHKSTQYSGVVGIENKGKGNHEFYFFLSPGFEYVAYNATIEGNLIGQSSVYTESREPLVFQTRAGVMLSFTRFDAAFIYYRRTKETSEATFHKYLGIRLSHRF